MIILRRLLPLLNPEEVIFISHQNKAGTEGFTYRGKPKEFISHVPWCTYFLDYVVYSILDDSISICTLEEYKWYLKMRIKDETE